MESESTPSTAVALRPGEPMRRGALVFYSMQDKITMARAFAQGNLFGAKTTAAALSLILIAESEGIHPAKAMQEYDVIEGKPVRKAEKCAARFIESGGKIRTLIYSDDEVKMHFSHPMGDDIELSWTIERARKIKSASGKVLADKDVWKNNPRQMLRSRCWSEGTKTCYPGYADITLSYEEMSDEMELRDVTPAALSPPPPPPPAEDTSMHVADDDNLADPPGEDDDAPPPEDDAPPQSPAAQHYRETDIPGTGFLKGAEKDEAVAAMTRAMESALERGGLEGLNAQWIADARTRRTRVSKNVAYGLEHKLDELRATVAPPAAEAGATESGPALRGEALYNAMRDRLYECKTTDAIKAWVATLTKPVMVALGDDWRDALNNEYRTHKQVTLGERAPE